MRRNPFYEVPPAAHIYRRTATGDASQDGPEEAVRQWCAFELIRAYGFGVTQLELERQVKVGSKTYRIDIAVLRNGSPWIVVECKEPEFARHEKAMEQAVSYADAAGIQAEFAVYTNGSTWLVSRKVQDEWVPVSDLPINVAADHKTSLAEILNAVYEIGPLLYQLDQPIEGEDAERFLHKMQLFIGGPNLLNEDSNQLLRHATDYLLRVLSVRNADLKYQFGKLKGAHRAWNSYRELIGSNVHMSEVDDGDRLAVAWCRLHSPLLGLIQGAPKPEGADVLLLRLDLALLDYGDAASAAGNQFPPITPAIHHALKDFLNRALTVCFNTRLPESISKEAVNDMKQYCSIYWEHS